MRERPRRCDCWNSLWAGSTRWNVTAESRTVDDRNHYQPQYANWGHSPANPTKAIRCQLYVMATPSFTTAQGATCISDSLTTYDVLGDPENTIIQLGRGSLYGVSASGGSGRNCDALVSANGFTFGQVEETVIAVGT